MIFKLSVLAPGARSAAIFTVGWSDSGPPPNRTDVLKGAAGTKTCKLRRRRLSNPIFRAYRIPRSEMHSSLVHPSRSGEGGGSNRILTGSADSGSLIFLDRKQDGMTSFISLQRGAHRVIIPAKVGERYEEAREFLKDRALDHRRSSLS